MNAYEAAKRTAELLGFDPLYQTPFTCSQIAASLEPYGETFRIQQHYDASGFTGAYVIMGGDIDEVNYNFVLCTVWVDGDEMIWEG